MCCDCRPKGRAEAAMRSSIQVCGECGALVPKGTRYCPFCGEAVEAKLLTELPGPSRQAQGDGAKLVVVCVVYAAFGVLGFALRRSTRLRTVSQAYLGVFALMTPLVLLAAYRFELRGLGFPAVGMVCISAAYVAAIYLL